MAEHRTRGLADRLAAAAAAVEAELERLLPPAAGAAQARLFEAMRYASLGGGKRLRPFLVLTGAGLFGAERAWALRVGAAVELVHCYSLVHDDLPAMDDALTRRGRPTVHRAFDDATAVLAGDALLTLAFEVLAAPATHPDPAVRCALVQGLAVAGGAAGMCGGQMIDLEAEHRRLDEPEILELQRLKTGALIGFACEAGAILGGAGEDARRRLRGYAGALGLAFQITDDLIDVAGDALLAGKDLGRDAEAGKATLVGLLGVDGARRRLAELRGRAGAELDALGPRAGPLIETFEYVMRRAA